MPTIRRPPTKQTPTTAVVPIAVDVDLVRFEKNLLSIGFFGANDSRDKNRTSRRIEQVVIRNGHRVKVAAEFRGSELLGLPSTTDRDKFIALLKIISEERSKTGVITNPIRFSGYRLIQELGLSRNGEIYEEILRWGKRMTDTTITSEQVVYRAAKKVYSDETLHVFRSFKRTGSSNLNGADRQEHYEVILEDWLIENLNQRYVIPEDFNAYKQLTRPTAKGIFGNLHLWFHASQGKSVEKDYSELCNLLNIQAYPHLSKIKSTMGLALNELIKIKYISKWDVLKMSSKDGYKVVLSPGTELMRILDNSKADRREAPSLSSADTLQDVPSQHMNAQQEEALEMLKKHGVLPSKAARLVEAYGPDVVADTVEYVESQALNGGRKNVENPAGLIIYSLENGLPIPAGFVTARKRRKAAEEAERERLKQGMLDQVESAYDQWLERQREAALREQFPGARLEEEVGRMVASLVKTDDRFRRMTSKARYELAYLMLRKEVLAKVELPTFEAWKASADAEQISLF